MQSVSRALGRRGQQCPLRSQQVWPWPGCLYKRNQACRRRPSGPEPNDVSSMLGGSATCFLTHIPLSPQRPPHGFEKQLRASHILTPFSV